MTDLPLQQLVQNIQIYFKKAGLSPDIADLWPNSELQQLKPIQSNEFAAMAHLPIILEQSPTETKMLVSSLINCTDQIQWGQTYSDKSVDTHFMENYCWAEIVGKRGPIASTQIALGVLILGSNTSYPKHSHPAEEFYLPLSGTADWFQQNNGWRETPPNSLIHHSSNEVHATQTNRQPMMAAYLWIGDLATNAKLT